MLHMLEPSLCVLSISFQKTSSQASQTDGAHPGYICTHSPCTQEPTCSVHGTHIPGIYTYTHRYIYSHNVLHEHPCVHTYTHALFFFLHITRSLPNNKQGHMWAHTMPAYIHESVHIYGRGCKHNNQIHIPTGFSCAIHVTM